MFWLTVKVTNTFDGTLLEREREGERQRGDRREREREGEREILISIESQKKLVRKIGKKRDRERKRWWNNKETGGKRGGGGKCVFFSVASCTSLFNPREMMTTQVHARERERERENKRREEEKRKKERDNDAKDGLHSSNTHIIFSNCSI